MLSDVQDCTLLADESKLAFEEIDHGLLPAELRISLPEKSPDAHCAVIRVELAEDLRVDNRLVENERGVIEMRVRRASLEKSPESFAKISPSGVTERWFSNDVRLTWEFFVTSPGEYAVETVLQTFFFGDWDVGFTLHADCGGQSVSAIYDPPEGNQSKLCSYEKRRLGLGKITLTEGSHRLTMHASGVPESLLKRCGVTLAAVNLIRQNLICTRIT